MRESSELGFVGTGGIGLFLYASINSFAWPLVPVILISTLAIVMLSETSSAAIRPRFS